MQVDTRLLIGDDRPDLDPARAIEVTNPADGRRLATIADATPSQVNDAVTAAEAAFEQWRRTSGADRTRLMHRLADLIDRDADALARLETADNGKLLRETSTQARFAARNYRFFAGLADKIHGRTIPLDSWDTFDYTVREPVGVAALITAWNSPMQLLANKLAPALAAGCTVVIKPSELAPLTTLRLADYVAEAGFPRGVVNIVTGGAETGAALTADPRLGRISFTGSVPTGQAIARAATRTLVPVTLELGGKSANIVFDDADLDRAVPGAVSGIFAAGGQTCIAGSRLLVHDSIHDEFVERVTEVARTIVLGDPIEEATQMGPVASSAQRQRILGMIQQAQADGARLMAGGRAPEDQRLAAGYFVEPTVFADVDPVAAIAQQEVFGPVLVTHRFADDTHAIAIANGTEFGLASGIWTSDVSRAHRVARELVAGTVWVNTYRYSAAQAPFGGVKKSGHGRERGIEAIDEYLRTKNVLIDLSTRVRDPFSIKA
ncbi:aldehyde dehydrogenase [Mycolicibacterium sp. S2-37]|uniref:aldehyde dehydrogenase n=1 Tax=Mycolicibacterium sp. S2-37 TaxID=2810297 RepID=UPI001A94316D|nr:aldehyde dehydrogenase [Mycolicibacterium sp. S2-37]MBO0679651.1 aldehyde dehydrogenase [Mycolicibacterium sp. S2-37]